MSYRNPARIVDTQSGAAFAQMQANITKDFKDLSNTIAAKYEKDKKETEARLQKAREDENASKSKVNVVASANPKTDFSVMTGLYKDYYDAKSTKAAEQTPAQRNLIANMKAGTIDQVLKNGLANVTADGQDFMAASKNEVGKTGGFYSGTGAADISYLGVLYGLEGAKGTKAVTFDPASDEPKVGFDITIDGVTKKVSDFKKPIIIPDRKEDMTQLVANASKTVGIGHENGAAYRGQSPITNADGQNPSVTANRQVFVDAIYNEAKSSLASMPLEEAIAFYNDVSRPEGAEPFEIQYQLTGGDNKDKEAKMMETMARAYSEHAATKFGQEALFKPVNYTETPKTTTKTDKPSAQAIKDANTIANTAQSIADMSFKTGRHFSYGNIRENLANLGLGFDLLTEEDEDGNEKEIGIMLKQGSKQGREISKNMSDEEVQVVVAMELSGMGRSRAQQIVKKSLIKEKEIIKKHGDAYDNWWEKNNPEPRQMTLAEQFADKKKGREEYIRSQRTLDPTPFDSLVIDALKNKNK